MKSMWYDHLGLFSIGVQCGGPEDGNLGDIKIDLSRLLNRHCTSTHCASIGHYAIIMRINGRFQEFGPEAIERIRRSKKDRDIKVEIIVPQSRWRGKPRNHLRDYLADRVRLAIEACVARLRKDREPVDEPLLWSEVDAALARFRQLDFEHASWQPPQGTA